MTQGALYIWAVDCFEEKTLTYYCIFRGRPFPIACSKKEGGDTRPYSLDDLGQRVAALADLGLSYRNEVSPDAQEERLTIFEQLAMVSDYTSLRRPLTGHELRRLRQHLGMDALRKVS